jgi:ornithine cyclodeaminase/alanine dehydrogenase-like protein (mu-crystallin family)
MRYYYIVCQYRYYLLIHLFIIYSGHDLSNGLIYISNNIFQPAAGYRKNVQQAVIVFTTAQSDDPSIDGSLFSSNHIKANGAVVVAVGVGPAVSQSELSALASQPSYAIFVNNPSDLLSISNAVTIATDACTPLPTRKRISTIF